MTLNRGFTMLEVMIALAIISILAAVAAPSLREMSMNAAITGSTNDLMNSLALARGEAVRRSRATTLCTSNNGVSCTDSQWHEGWIVIVDADNDGELDAGETALRSQTAADKRVRISSEGHRRGATNAQFVSYAPNGSLSRTQPLPVIFTMCDLRTASAVGSNAAQDKGRTVTLSTTGRALAQRWTCP